MKYKIKNVHKTLFIKERYQILSERNDNSLNNFSEIVGVLQCQLFLKKLLKKC